jgi:hypothetical protein
MLEEIRLSLDEIRHMLAQTMDAHHQFEETELNGVYDAEWPAWYASYLLDRGLNDELKKPVTLPQLTRFLSESNRRYEQLDKEEAWADFTAVDLIARLG